MEHYTEIFLITIGVVVSNLTLIIIFCIATITCCIKKRYKRQADTEPDTSSTTRSFSSGYHSRRSSQSDGNQQEMSITTECRTSQPDDLIFENPSLLLSATAGPILDQGHQFSTDLISDAHSEDTQQRKGSLTYSRETQILLPTSGPPIDPDNTREYIPACFSPVATLQCIQDDKALLR